MVDDENVKVSVAQNEQSEDGEKVFTIILENKDGSKTGVYQITVKKPEQNQVMTTQGNKDNTIYYILAAIIGVLLLLIVIIIIALKKTSNKEDDDEKDDYDYSLKDAIDNVNLDEEIEENGKTFNGTVVWADSNIDLAIIKVDEIFNNKINIGDSNSVKVGENVYAIGNPVGFEFQRTVTKGIISGLSRTSGLFFEQI